MLSVYAVMALIVIVPLGSHAVPVQKNSQVVAIGYVSGSDLIEDLTLKKGKVCSSFFSHTFRLD